MAYVAAQQYGPYVSSHGINFGGWARAPKPGGCINVGDWPQVVARKCNGQARAMSKLRAMGKLCAAGKQHACEVHFVKPDSSA